MHQETLAELKYSVYWITKLSVIFRNSQKSFYTSARTSNLNNRGYWPFFKLNDSVYWITEKPQFFFFFVNAIFIVEVEKWSIASIIWVGSSRSGAHSFKGMLKSKLLDPAVYMFSKLSFSKEILVWPYFSP